MSGHSVIRFELDINANQYLNFYKGTVRRISVIASDGKRIEFDARHIKPFLTHDGIRGTFEMELAENNQFVSIKRIG